MPGWLAAEPLSAGAELIRFRWFRHFKSQLPTVELAFNTYSGIEPLITVSSKPTPAVTRHQAPLEKAREKAPKERLKWFFSTNPFFQWRGFSSEPVRSAAPEYT
jgi:hypothetical protein